MAGRRAAFIHDQGRAFVFESAQSSCSTLRWQRKSLVWPCRCMAHMGAMHSLTVERLYRDAKMLELYAGVSEMQRVIIANNLLERGAAGR